MNDFLHGCKINITTPPVFTVENFYDYLNNNGYAYIQNAFDISLLCSDSVIAETINSFIDTTANQTLRQHISVNKNIYNFIQSSLLIKKLKQYINPLYCQEFCFIRKKKDAPGTRIHRDGDDTFFKNDRSINFGINKRKEQFIYTIWVALMDVKMNNSSICLLNYKDENIKIDNYWTNDINEILNNSKFIHNHPNWIGRDMKKGDAVIFSSDLVHASTDCTEGVRSSLDMRISTVDYKDLVFLDHGTMVYRENILNKDYFVL